MALDLVLLVHFLMKIPLLEDWGRIYFHPIEGHCSQPAVSAVLVEQPVQMELPEQMELKDLETE